MSTSQISSGQMINVQQIVSGLMSIEQRPLQTLTTRISTVNVQISSVSQIKSLVEEAFTAAKAVEDPLMLSSKVVASSDETLVKAKVTDAAAATVGAVSFKPLTLSGAQRTTFAGFSASDSPLDSQQFGELTISIPASSTLLAAGADSKSLTVQAGGKTLLEIAAEVNASLPSELRATVIKSDIVNKYVLSLVGAKGGEDARFSADWDAQTVSNVATNGLLSGSITNFDITARNATALVDGGILVSSTTNTFSEVLPGLEVEVKSLASGNAANVANSVTLSVGDSREQFRQRLSNFASAFTKLTQKIKELTQPESADSKKGALALDSGTLSLISNLYQAYSSGITLSENRTWQDSNGLVYGSSSRPLSWSRLGLEMARGGVVSLNSVGFDNAMNSSLGNTLVGGFSSSLSNVLSSFKGVSGSLNRAVDAMKTNLSALQNSKTEQEQRIDRKRAALIAQYSALDAKLTQMNQISQNVRSSLSGLAR